MGKAVESVAKESSMESCIEERKIAIAAGAEIDSQNLVGVTCSYDMEWQKQRKAHNSSTGHGAVLGVATGKVFGFCYKKQDLPNLFCLKKS